MAVAWAQRANKLAFVMRRRRLCDKSVSEHNTCRKSSECAVLTFGCPFGCYVGVRSSDLTIVQSRGHDPCEPTRVRLQVHVQMHPAPRGVVRSREMHDQVAIVTPANKPLQRTGLAPLR
jgi:hypothetical protein